jgi:hypothetical protein
MRGWRSFRVATCWQFSTAALPVRFAGRRPAVLDTAALEIIHQERYERFLRSAAWQVLICAAWGFVSKRTKTETKDGIESQTL